MGAELMELNLTSVTLAAVASPEMPAAAACALSAAEALQLPCQVLGLIDAAALRNVGPVPLGGDYYAGQLRKHRLAEARRHLADAMADVEEICRAHHAAPRMQVDEGNALGFLRAREGSGRSLWVVPAHGGFQQGASSDEARAASLLGRIATVMLVVSGDVRPVERVAVSAEAEDQAELRLTLAARLWPEATYTVFGPHAVQQAACLAGLGMQANVGEQATRVPPSFDACVAAFQRPNWLERLFASRDQDAAPAPLALYG